MPFPTERVLTDDQIEELAEALRGTTRSLEEELESRFDLTEDEISIEDNRALDDRVFMCDGCGWWCALEEYNEGEVQLHEQLCDDCAVEGEEDKEN